MCEDKISDEDLNELRDFFTPLYGVKDCPKDSVSEQIIRNTPNSQGTSIREGVGGKMEFYRFDNIDELGIPENGTHIINLEEGIDLIAAFAPFNEFTFKEKEFLLCYGINFFYLNSYVSKYGLTRVLMWRNFTCLKYPLSNQQVLNIVDDILYRKSVGTLTPIITKRYIVHAFNSCLSVEEKRSLNGAVGSKVKVNESKKKIRSAIDSWDFPSKGKITQKTLKEKTGMSKNTIEKYYPEFKAGIIDLNLGFKLISKKKKK